MKIPGRLPQTQTHKPELIVFVIGILLVLAGAILLEIVPSDAWVFAAMLVIWGIGAIVNAIIRFVRTTRQR